MSERSEASRSGGRAQSRGTAGGPQRRVSRDADTGTGARAARRSEGADTRRSGIRSGKGRDTAAPVDGATALSIEVTGEAAPVPGDTPPAPGGRPRLWVAPPLPIRAPRATFAAVIIAVVLAGVLGILLINTKTMEQSFRLDALRKEKAVLDKQQQELERQLVEASGPGNLTAAARRLGLVPAEDPAVLWLPNGDVVSPPKPATGPTSPTAQEGLQKAGDPAAAGDESGTAGKTGSGATTGNSGQTATGGATGTTGQTGTGGVTGTTGQAATGGTAATTGQTGGTGTGANAGTTGTAGTGTAGAGTGTTGTAGTGAAGNAGTGSASGESGSPAEG